MVYNARVRLTPVNILAIFAAAALIAFALYAKPAKCDAGCIPMICGSSATCIGSCVCAVSPGKAIGRCVSTR